MLFTTLTWSQLKTYKSQTKVPLKYIELNDMFIIRACDETFNFECALLKNGDNTTEIADFETNFQEDCNQAQATLSRITTNKIGRRLHDRYISITTADQDNYDNTDYNDDDYGDVTYIMKDINGDATTTDIEAKETWIIFEPTFDYEIWWGKVYVPAVLSGENDDAWECHAIAVPDIPAPTGCIELIANPRLKWKKGGEVGKEVVNPAELKYSEIYHTNKILIIFKHPVGAQCEFQINLAMFK